MKTLEDIQRGLMQPLSSSEIELRVGRENKSTNKISLLAYKDARVDANRLDSVVGCFNWQRKHEFKNGILYCSVGVKNAETQEWIWKEDCGTESNTEAEKGQSSDSFKRACFMWGIGRELYDMPLIEISSDYKFKLKWLKMQLAYFKGTNTLALMKLSYGKEVLFAFKHPNFNADCEIVIDYGDGKGFVESINKIGK